MFLFTDSARPLLWGWATEAKCRLIFHSLQNSELATVKLWAVVGHYGFGNPNLLIIDFHTKLLTLFDVVLAIASASTHFVK